MTKHLFVAANLCGIKHRQLEKNVGTSVMVFAQLEKVICTSNLGKNWCLFPYFMVCSGSWLFFFDYLDS